MSKQIGRNDPCPCGSGKKYKACCWNKEKPGAKKQFSAKLLSGKVNLIERAFGESVKIEKPLEELLHDAKIRQEEKKKAQEG